MLGLGVGRRVRIRDGLESDFGKKTIAKVTHAIVKQQQNLH